MSEFQTPETVAKVRRGLASSWVGVLASLERERKAYEDNVPEEFVKKLKICSDQLRIEFRITEGLEDEIPEGSADDPLGGLTVVTEDAA